MEHNRIQFFVLFCLFFVFASFGANVLTPKTTYFKKIDISNGLPDNSINDIAEDEYGFLWIATWNGLARYDGKEIVSYRHRDDQPSLSSSMVRAIYPTRSGLWIGTDNGLDYFDFNTSSFHKAYFKVTDGTSLIKTRISRIMGNGNGIFAITNEGNLLKLDCEASSDDKFYFVFRILPKPDSRRYADFSLYTRGRIMAISNEGITILSNDGEDELYHNSIRQNFDSNINIKCDTINGRVYTGAGIGSKAVVYNILSPEGRLAPASEQYNIRGLMCTAIENGSIIMATDGNGLYHIDEKGVKTCFLPSNSSLPCDAVYDVFTDRNNNIWCGTYRHGLCMVSKELNTYTLFNKASGSVNYDIITAIEPSSDKLYLGLDGGGFDVFDAKTSTSKNFNVSNSNIPGNNVVSLYNDGVSIWGAVYSGGLFKYNPRTEAITKYIVNSDDEVGNKLWVITGDDDGNIWTGGLSLHLFNKDTATFTPIKATKDAGITSIEVDGEYIWVSTRKIGILKINRKTLEIEDSFCENADSESKRLKTNHVPFIFLDSSRRMWINQSNRYFSSVDLKNESEIEIYDEHKGLSNMHVCSIIEDPHGNLWIGTDDGLFKYLRNRNTFIRKKESCVPPTYTPNANATIGSTAYFGTTNGLLSYPINAAEPTASTAQTIFTGIDILDENRTKLPLHSTGNHTIELDHTQNFFTINFTVPEMHYPDLLMFECRLDGLEDVWRDVTSTRTATYTNVPQGDYTLYVRHTNLDGSWTVPASIKINIKPAWYSSSLMVSVWLMLIVAAICTIFYIWYKYNRNQEKTKMVEFERDSLKRLNEAKLDFYASITHELRTPSFLISAQIEEMLDSGRKTISISNLTGIYRNSAKLNKLINHIIDFRKNDTGHLKLSPRRTELIKFFSDLTIDYEQLCRQKSLDFSFIHEADSIEASVDPDKLEQIVTNLVSNSYKYTPKGGKVTLTVTDLGDKISISLSDTGIGIIDKMQSAIFEPYFRTERGQSQSKGDGIGLAFVKELVELHNGSIDLESQVNEGSTFTVTLPKANEMVVDTEDEPKHPLASIAPIRNDKEPVEIISNPTATHAILIVDDDPEVSSIVSRAFGDDYRVSRAADGEQGLQLAQTGDYDAIITDLMMPEVDGHQLIKSLKADKRTKNIKIVVFSALTSEDDMLRAFDEGADAFLSKPTPLKVLRRQVEKLFEESEDPVTGTTANSGAYTREEQKFLIECRRIIDESLSDENFGIEMLATKLAMSHSSLYKKIRKMTGMSLIDFINEYRICKAVALFRNGNTNVQKVAETCGFRDIKTFRETFKRKMNMPPKQFITSLNVSDEEPNT